MSNSIEDIRKSIEEIISETDEAQLLLYTVEEDIQMLQKDNAKLKDENARLRELAKDACTVLRGFYVPEWFDETVLAERMCELGIEVDE